MALAILPVAFILGLLIRDARRASIACLSVWLVGMVAFLAAILGGTGVSPWEALAFAVCLGPAVLLARLGVRLSPSARGA